MDTSRAERLSEYIRSTDGSIELATLVANALILVDTLEARYDSPEHLERWLSFWLDDPERKALMDAIVAAATLACGADGHHHCGQKGPAA